MDNRFFEMGVGLTQKHELGVHTNMNYVPAATEIPIELPPDMLVDERVASKATAIRFWFEKLLNRYILDREHWNR